MKNIIVSMMLTAAFILFGTAVSFATPAAQIWIPSTDVQTFGTVRLNIINFFRASGESSADSGARDPNILDIGPTVGILPFEKIRMEVGFDYITLASNPNDNHPLAFNAKIATPEDSLFEFSPALAVGMYNFGPTLSAESAPLAVSGQNIVYGLVAKTFPLIGRISAGYYHGNGKALVDTMGKAANDGVMVSWDRVLSEISDKLWVAVDYMGGNNVNGAVSFGASWSFTENIYLLFGYNAWKEKSLAGNNTFTTQLGITFP